MMALRETLPVYGKERLSSKAELMEASVSTDTMCMDATNNTEDRRTCSSSSAVQKKRWREYACLLESQFQDMALILRSLCLSVYLSPLLFVASSFTSFCLPSARDRLDTSGKQREGDGRAEVAGPWLSRIFHTFDVGPPSFSPLRSLFESLLLRYPFVVCGPLANSLSTYPHRAAVSITQKILFLPPAVERHAEKKVEEICADKHQHVSPPLVALEKTPLQSESQCLHSFPACLPSPRTASPSSALHELTTDRRSSSRLFIAPSAEEPSERRTAAAGKAEPPIRSTRQSCSFIIDLPLRSSALKDVPHTVNSKGIFVYTDKHFPLHVRGHYLEGLSGARRTGHAVSPSDGDHCSSPLFLSVEELLADVEAISAEEFQEGIASLCSKRARWKLGVLLLHSHHDVPSPFAAATWGVHDSSLTPHESVGRNTASCHASTVRQNLDLVTTCASARAEAKTMPVIMGVSDTGISSTCVAGFVCYRFKNESPTMTRSRRIRRAGRKDNTIKNLEIAKLCILKGLRGKGYGRCIMKEVIKKARKLGNVNVVGLSSLSSAVGFYKRLGFRSYEGVKVPDDKELNRRREEVCEKSVEGLTDCRGSTGMDGGAPPDMVKEKDVMAVQTVLTAGLGVTGCDVTSDSRPLDSFVEGQVYMEMPLRRQRGKQGERRR